jgi:hypothetical protein
MIIAADAAPCTLVADVAAALELKERQQESSSLASSLSSQSQIQNRCIYYLTSQDSRRGRAVGKGMRRDATGRAAAAV